MQFITVITRCLASKLAAAAPRLMEFAKRAVLSDIGRRLIADVLQLLAKRVLA